MSSLKVLHCKVFFIPKSQEKNSIACRFISNYPHPPLSQLCDCGIIHVNPAGPFVCVAPCKLLLKEAEVFHIMPYKIFLANRA